MGYRIRIVPEVEAWLAELRESDPAAAGLTDDALDLLREGGAGLGPPLVVPFRMPARQLRPDLDYAYRRQLEALNRSRRRVADAATARKRLELQLEQLEQTAARLADQLARAPGSGDEDVAVAVLAEAAGVTQRLGELRRRYATTQSQEELAVAASRRLQVRTNDFRLCREAIEAAESAAEAAAEAARAEALIQDADPGPSFPAGPIRIPSPPDLSELRPGAPGHTGIRILFAAQPPDTALLLAAGTERDWLNAWYAEVILRCRDRHERDQGSAG